MDHHTVETCTVFRQIRVFFGGNGHHVLQTKDEKVHQNCYQQQVQKYRDRVKGRVSALGKGNLHFCDGTINAEKYTEILKQHMLPSR